MSDAKDSKSVMLCIEVANAEAASVIRVLSTTLFALRCDGEARRS